MPREVTTFLMFDGVAEQAMNIYVSLFTGSRIKSVERYKAAEPGPEGTIKLAEFTLADHHLKCIDSPIKHDFTFTPAVSLFVDCVDDAELAHV
jgi:predicted 3-demethylubiquinone-9 3-methyltransferase (glyoxalase superfamily)